MQALRRFGTQGTELPRAQCSTLCLKPFKVGARIRITARRAWLSFSQAFPYAATFPIPSGPDDGKTFPGAP